MCYLLQCFIVSYFFAVYGINSILYQRGIYAPETFTRVQKYGLTILVTTDEELKKYLSNILADVKGWLRNCNCDKYCCQLSMGCKISGKYSLEIFWKRL